MPTPAFIQRLRSKVGHDELLFLPGVVGVVVDGRGRVLLVHSAQMGRWMPVGGCVEPGEEPAECIVREVREVREETGLRVVVERLVSVDAWDDVTYANGDRCRFVTTTFRCLPVDDGAVPRVADEESSEVGYFAPAALPADVAPQQRRRIELALRDEERAAFVVGGEIRP